MKQRFADMKTARLLTLMGGVSLLAVAAAAQDPAPPAAPAKAEESPVRLEDMEVTGSYIPYASDAPAIPVQTLTADDIAKTGVVSDMMEVVRKSSPQFMGNGNLGSSNSNIAGGSTNGGSQLLLRNTTTLVLINGRRAAFAPVAATGGYQFVDLNSIPVSAVEKIEILTDGASALYGSDAVSGVVNIILKDNYEGLEIGGTYTMATDEGTRRGQQAYFTTGAKKDKFSVTVSGEYFTEDPLWQWQRAVSTPSYGTPTFPGVVQIGGTGTGRYYILNPELNAPPAGDRTEAELVSSGVYQGNPATGQAYTYGEILEVFDLSRNVTLLLGNERKSAIASWSLELSDKMQAFGDIMMSRTDTFAQINAQPITDVPIQTYAASAPQNPFDITVRARNRLVDFPRQYINDSTSLRIVAGLKGQISEALSFETALNYNGVSQHYANPGVLNRDNLASAKASGALNMFAYRQEPVALANARLVGTATSDNDSSLVSWDGRVFGKIPGLELPGGPIEYAIGGEIRSESLSGNPDPGSYLNPDTGDTVLWAGATTANPFEATRDIMSAFSQIRVPIVGKNQKIPGLYTLDLDIAARYDQYSDTQDPLVPKFLLRYLPFNDELAFRFSYNRSFNAPRLYDLFGPAGVGFTPELTNFQVYNGEPLDTFGQANYRTLTSSTLLPEKSKNYNFGVVYSPRAVKGLTVELSYFNIKLTDLITRYSAQSILEDVELNGADSEFVDWVRIGGFLGDRVTGPGQIVEAGSDEVYLSSPLINAASTAQDGLDLKVDYVFDIEGVGRFANRVNATWYNSYSFEGTDTVGLVTSTNGTIPRYMLYASTVYTRGNFEAAAGIQFIPGMWEEDGYVGDARNRVDSWNAIDMSVGYTFSKPTGFLRHLDGLKVSLGCNNVFSQGVPPSPTVNSDANGDVATYISGTIGRQLWGKASFKF